MEAAIVVTYRCNARCAMCGTWKHPSRREEEFAPELLRKLPSLAFANVTGGEPFLREDLGEIVSVLSERSSRVVISTNGYFTDRVVALSDRFPAVGIRISLEGLPAANDELRGLRDGFDHGLRTLLELQRRGIKDIGFGITVSDRNAEDMLELYQLARAMNLEFATAVVHNSYYFHKHDNAIRDPEKVIRCFEELIRRAAGEPPAKGVVPGLLQLRPDQLCPGEAPPAPLRRRIRHVLRRSRGRDPPLQRIGGGDPREQHGESRGRTVRGDLERREGAGDPGAAAILPAQLLDDRHRLPGDEEGDRQTPALDPPEQAPADDGERAGSDVVSSCVRPSERRTCSISFPIRGESGRIAGSLRLENCRPS